MDKVTVGNIADSKPSMTLSAEAAAAITVGAGELVIAMGTGVIADHTILVPGTGPIGNNQRAITAFENLRDRLKEANFPVGPLAVNLASGTPPNAEGYVVTNVAAIPALTEDDALIAYGATFYPAGNSTNVLDIINRAMEVYQEQVLKLN